MLFAAAHESGSGPNAKFSAALKGQNDAIDPNVWTGCVSQERTCVDLRKSLICIRPI